MARERLVETAQQVYRSYGFSPIDTPALEYSEILLGKGGNESDKQLFRFTDQGNRDVSMRFDLTIPFARFAAQHFNEIGMPFKRYHSGTVWRAEKPQRGRYREFMQCDFDTIGTKSNVADIETLFVIHDLFEKLGFSNFTICVNSRMILNGILEEMNLTEKAVGILRALDKHEKIGLKGVLDELINRVGLSREEGRQIQQATRKDKGLSSIECLNLIQNEVGDNETACEGIERMRELFTACEKAEISMDRVQFEPSIARGLDYYTGTIYETFLNHEKVSGIGSVCSGGRYDNLAGLFTSQPLPGVGASLGLDRLLAAMGELGMIPSAGTPAPVLVTLFDAAYLGEYLRIGRLLRHGGIETEVYPDTHKLGKQLKYASRKGFRIALIAGSDEFDAGIWQIKDLEKEEQQQVPKGELLVAIREILSG